MGNQLIGFTVEHVQRMIDILDSIEYKGISSAAKVVELSNMLSKFGQTVNLVDSNKSGELEETRETLKTE